MIETGKEEKAIEMFSFLRAMRRGLRDNIGESALHLLNGRWLSQLCAGDPLVSAGVLENLSTFDHLAEGVKAAFWGAVRQLTNKERALLLHFVTGSERLPLDLKDFHICMQPDTGRYLKASTCSRVVFVPRYKSVEEAKKSILISIHSQTTELT